MSPVHLAFVAMIALIFLGPRKLPELARSIGSGIREFRDSMSLGDEAKASVAEIREPVSPVAAPVAPVASAPAVAPAATVAPEPSPAATVAPEPPR